MKLTDGGYEFQVAMQRPGIKKVTTFATDDGSGSGSQTIDAPSGDTLIVVTLTFTNKTNRPEPFGYATTAPLPTSNDVPRFDLAVPQAQAAAFGISQNSCGGGYCTMGAYIGAFSPALTDPTQAPQLAPGASGTVTLVAGLPGATTGNGPVPEGAPIDQVKAFVIPTAQDAGNGTWAWLP